ncbi:hypothetical protein [Desulfitobacterium hafniense]|nr:hypothetical protein [Desulfitobacterium hafniense]
MKPSEIEELLQEFGSVSWKSFDSQQGEEGFFLLKVNPLPPLEELQLVVADICVEGVPVCVNKGKVYHSNSCNRHDHALDDVIEEALNRLKEETFLIAVHPNTYKPFLHSLLPYGGKPLAIPFNPVISYMNFPDHPHLNMGNNEALLPGIPLAIPDTICFTAEPNSGLGDTLKDRLLYTFDQLTIWLLRHQIWVATREITGHGKWIGPHEGQLEAEDFLQRLNPQGSCRCGNKKPYNFCHLKEDLKAFQSKHGFLHPIVIENYLQYKPLWRQQVFKTFRKINPWVDNVLKPQIELYEMLNSLSVGI